MVLGEYGLFLTVLYNGGARGMEAKGRNFKKKKDGLKRTKCLFDFFFVQPQQHFVNLDIPFIITLFFSLLYSN